MAWHRAGPAAVAILALAAAAPAQEEPVARKTGTYCTVIFHGGDEALATQALAVADAVWPIVAKAFGVPDAKPSEPLAVHVYRTVEGYREADRKLTGGKFRRNQAMSHFESRSAHIALQPPCRDETLRALGLPPLTKTMIAWETTHLARFELCPNFRQHPDWLCDGLAAWVAAEVATAPETGPKEATPFWAQDMILVQRLLESGKLPPVASLLSDKVADLDLSDRYATRVVLYAFLASEPNRERLGTLLGTVRRTGGGDGYGRAVLDAAMEAFGKEDEAFAKYVRGLAPEWEEVYRSLWTTGTDWTQIAFPDGNAIAWRRNPLGSSAFAAKGSLRILPGDAQQMNFLFARTPDGFYSLAFVADSGFTLFDYRSKTSEWVQIGKGNAPGLRLGVTTDFALDGHDAKLTVQLDGLTWNFDLPRPLPKDLVWGLGTQASREGAATGSAGIWKDVVVTPRDR
jgi:hypothetical protein